MNKKYISIIGVLIIFSVLVLQTSVFSQSAGATITGKVTYQGPEVKPQPVNFGAEKQCAMMHKDKMPMNEDIVINPNGTVKWALVSIKEEVPGDYPVPTEPVVVNQLGCVFQPHGASVRVGQPVEFRNDDEVLHNVRGFSTQGQSFNIAQPLKGMKTKKTLMKPEPKMQLKCDVHFWMVSYLHVMPNPFYAITGDDGTFTISSLPAGTYTLELWHEKLGTQTQTITVKDGETQNVDFVLEKK